MAVHLSCTDCRALLDAYHDGELTPQEHAEVAEHVAACADCARALEALATTSHLLRAGLVRYSAPDVLRARIESAIANDEGRDPGRLPRRGRLSHPVRQARLIAAAAVIAVASSAATVLVMSGAGSSHTARERSVASEVLASHLRSLLPGHLVDVASTNQHNVKPWFNGRADLSPAVPDLDSAAFPLVGGRLDYVAGHRAAAVVYARRQHLINAYSWTEVGDDESPSTTTLQGYHAVYWRFGGVETWVVSDLNQAELSEFVARYRSAEGARE